LKHFFAILILIFSASAARSQTISPLVTECGKKCVGSFTVQNNAVIPMVTTVEAYSFGLDSKGQHFRSLDSTAHVTLSETSARLGPKEIREFNYKIRCDALPCEVGILASMVVGHTQAQDGSPGIQVRLALEHCVYVCDKSKNCRRSLLDEAGLQAHK
jgi:hypothetical protein